MLDNVKTNMILEKQRLNESNGRYEGSYNDAGCLWWNSEENDQSDFVASNTRMVRMCVSSSPLYKSKLFLFDFDFWGGVKMEEGVIDSSS